MSYYIRVTSCSLTCTVTEYLMYVRLPCCLDHNQYHGVEYSLIVLIPHLMTPHCHSLVTAHLLAIMHGLRNQRVLQISYMVPSSQTRITFAGLSRLVTSVKTISVTAVADGKSIGFCNSLGKSKTVACSNGLGICLCAKGRRSNHQCLLQSR